MTHRTKEFHSWLHPKELKTDANKTRGGEAVAPGGDVETRQRGCSCAGNRPGEAMQAERQGGHGQGETPVFHHKYDWVVLTSCKYHFVHLSLDGNVNGLERAIWHRGPRSLFS